MCQRQSERAPKGPHALGERHRANTHTEERCGLAVICVWSEDSITEGQDEFPRLCGLNHSLDLGPH